jgi:hypothetical protein
VEMLSLGKREYKMKEHRNVGMLETTFRAKLHAILRNEQMGIVNSLNFDEGSCFHCMIYFE